MIRFWDKVVHTFVEKGGPLCHSTQQNKQEEMMSRTAVAGQMGPVTFAYSSRSSAKSSFGPLASSSSVRSSGSGTTFGTLPANGAVITIPDSGLGNGTFAIATPFPDHDRVIRRRPRPRPPTKTALLLGEFPGHSPFRQQTSPPCQPVATPGRRTHI